MARAAAGLWKNLIALQVYGANTGVGKTVFSTLLGSHFARRSKSAKWRLHYIKPVSTGPLTEADDLYVKRYVKGADVTTLYQFDEAVSPHVAARGFAPVTNDDLIRKLSETLQKDANQCTDHPDARGLSLVETAGGVLSPAPSGLPQADVFRPLRLPVILVGDHRLGGIASTISAAESLTLRGYDISAVICFDDKSKYENSRYLSQYFADAGIPAFEVPWIPHLEGRSETQEREVMGEYYQTQSASEALHSISGSLIQQHIDRIERMNDLPAVTNEKIWHPFTQHKSVTDPQDILVFDSAYGDFFQAKRKQNDQAVNKGQPEHPLLNPAFDGSASWWTQGLGHGNPKLSLAASYAAGRYGHVMFAGATHEPAVRLSEKLLEGMDNPRLKKVFYTDDGSTAVEAGIKMALRATCKRYGWDGSSSAVSVIGLKGSYHGDTIGAMDASEPCVYNKKVDWYRGRGFWFDYPVVKMIRGRYLVQSPEGLSEQLGESEQFDHLDDVFDFELRSNQRKVKYEEYIAEQLDHLVRQKGMKFGALIIEPIVLGAGGMLFVDPLFQRTLVEVVRKYKFSDAELEPSASAHDWTGLPVLFDEVFTGLHRLGHFTPSKLLKTNPDITAHAKLLTGGLLPLSATLASQSIFDAFLGDEKSDALLHGHSYTAHPIGCHVANTTLREMDVLQGSPTYDAFRRGWARGSTTYQSSGDVVASTPSDIVVNTWSMWDKSLVKTLSYHSDVNHVFALGSVLVVSLKDRCGSEYAYTSSAALGVRDALMRGGEEPDAVKVHSRVLGNVIYFMASLTSRPEELKIVGEALLAVLGKE